MIHRVEETGRIFYSGIDYFLRYMPEAAFLPPLSKLCPWSIHIDFLKDSSLLLWS